MDECDERPATLPIINCHAHVFTGKHVPARLARALVPWPLHWFINVHWLLGVMKAVERLKGYYYRTPWCRSLHVGIGLFKNGLARLRTLAFLAWVLDLWMGLHAFFFIVGALAHLHLVKAPGILQAEAFLRERGLLLPWTGAWVKVLVLLYVLVLARSARRLLLVALKNVWSLLGKIPGEHIKELWDRYRLIVRFTLYGRQSAEKKASRSGQASVFYKLAQQYPPGSHFIVLPMDMAYMGAGPMGRNGSYAEQMEELKDLKGSPTYGSRIHPFIFIDPRRIREEGRAFFDWTQNGDRIELLPCAVKEYLDAGFCGFKIYPALGYYPFDEDLLPLWRYAVQEDLPIMTHCIRGIIFYRGEKAGAWDRHPVFMRNTGHAHEPLEMLQVKNHAFQENFTHPLNYLCLLNECLLRILVSRGDARLKALFGFTNADTPLLRDLSKLKVCLAHFGGEDEWARHLESDTNTFNQQINIWPDRGIDFDVCRPEGVAWDRLEKYWKEVDWYSIICSLILQYTNVYADISYILHDPAVRPLLVRTLKHPGRCGHLPKRVLYGTDFYVVRNHLSDKELLANVQAGLSEADFDRIARVNPRDYLSRCFQQNAPPQEIGPALPQGAA